MASAEGLSGAPARIHSADVSPDVAVSVAARPENVGLVRNVLVSACEGLNLPAAFISRLTLAVSEACTNVVVHAYEDSPTGSMHMTAVVESDGMRVAIRDDGRGMRPRIDSPGLGFGVPLIAAVADEVEFCSDSSGNEVCMSFRTTT
jgi:serine/threonine-protein kinase RsbW